ncbi:MAG: AAA family ATPase [Planctomycetota bacterium]
MEGASNGGTTPEGEECEGGACSLPPHLLARRSAKPAEPATEERSDDVVPAPCLLLVCGLPASGKSWLSEHLAPLVEADLFQSDVRRRRMFEVPDGEHYRGPYDQGMYTPEAKQRVYDSLRADARNTIESGRRAVVDGSFVQRRWRAPFAELGRALGCPFLFVEVVCDEETVRRRIEARLRERDQPSDADWNVYLKLKEQREPFDDVEPLQHVEVVSGTDMHEVVLTLGAKLRAQLA